MISNLFKFLFSLTTSSGCIYCIQIFGFSYGLVALLVASFFILISAFYTSISVTAKYLANGISLFSLLALALLLIAGNIGGSFNLSPSNEIVAIFLFFISLFGLTSFFWSVPSIKNNKAT